MSSTKKIVRLALPVSFFLLIFIFPSKSNAWGGDVHNYLCPQELQGVEIQGTIVGCGMADSYEFQKSYPFSQVMNHLCLDNKADCPPRIVAKYYVKRYYLEGKNDLKLLAAAAHLIQDATCPDHWFPMRGFGEKIFVPFAPSWLSKTEGEVSFGLSSQRPEWSVVRQYQGKTIVLNQTYMDGLKEEITRFVATPPSEDLATLEKQIKYRSFWQKVRSYREWCYLVLTIFAPLIMWQYWRFKKTGKDKIDLIIEGIFFGLVVLVLILGHLFY